MFFLSSPNHPANPSPTGGEGGANLVLGAFPALEKGWG
jgi:hypothetical protein